MKLPFRASALTLAITTSLAVADPAQVLDKVVVRGTRLEAMPVNSFDPSGDELAARRAYVSDTAALLADAPGVSLYGSGGVSSLPAIHGLNDDRVRIRLNGMDLTSACGNHMNPPLSYIDPANVGQVRVMAGITPVSAGGDSIAGTIVMESPQPVFAGAGEGVRYSGSLSSFYRSNGHASGGSLTAGAAGESLALSYTGALVHAGNYKSGDGLEVRSSKYESQNHAVSFAVRDVDRLLAIQVGQQHIPYQGFPNARMDMVNNDATFGNIRYHQRYAWGDVELRAFYEHTRHDMGFLQDKGGAMPMKTDGESQGYSIRGDIHLSERDLLRIGHEYQSFRLDDWWPPVAGSMMMGPGTFKNIENGRRNRLGAFAEWEADWGGPWSSQLGIRYDGVTTDADSVRPYSWMSPMQVADRAAANAFNARRHRRMDDNVDMTALGRYAPDPGTTVEAGYARKTRSPNLYERYTWATGGMAMSMNGWFGDGNGYLGDIELKPEVAHTLSATFSRHDAEKKVWRFDITPYYTYVKDYIDADRCPVALGGACTAGNLNAPGQFVYLRFANHDARLYGVDISGRMPLAEGGFGRFSGRGVLGYVRGTNQDTHDRLYHLMPLNARLTLVHELGAWASELGVQLVAAKDKVQESRNELRTAGYGLVNLRTRYDWQRLRLEAGVENLLDKQYDLPLGGAYLGARPMTWGTPVAGMGRNVYVGLTMRF